MSSAYKYLYVSIFFVIVAAVGVYLYADIGEIPIQFGEFDTTLSPGVSISSATILILAILSVTVLLVDRSIGLPRTVQAIGVSFAVALFVVALYLLIFAAHWQAFAVCLVGATGTLTWALTNSVTVQNLRIQHTFDILLRMRENTVFLQHRDNLLQRYPQGQRIKLTDIEGLLSERNDNFSSSLYESVRYLLNYYEFISYGIRKGDLDSTLMEQTVGDIMIRFREKVRPIYERQKQVDRERFPDARKSKVYEHYDWLLDECWGSRNADFSK
ncbi:DUF4760 domain-containing protein [Parvularcula sp. IMCC14364]|uniref:DUF4760 domain-containing protein n=1 Tax=Parvularcula sp. IMCC14364 TaxID=3067902 RepID=UPI0027427193|nr:DUF4760 domain-containing protein [Parvularcula sp. IMCC14364]